MSRLKKRKRESRLQLTQDLCKTIYTANVNTNAIERIEDLIAKGAYLNKFVDVCLSSEVVSVKPLGIALCWKGNGSNTHVEYKNLFVNIVKILLENGADPNNSPHMPFLICCLYRPIDDRFTRFRQHSLEIETAIKLVNLLLDAGADPNQRTSFNGQTALFYALNTFPEVVETLVRHGANPFITDSYGCQINNYHIGIFQEDIIIYTENFQKAYKFLKNYMQKFVSEDDFIAQYNGAKQAEGLLMVFYARMPPNTDVIDLVSNQLPTFAAGNGKYRILIDGLVEKVTRYDIEKKFRHYKARPPHTRHNTCSSLHF